MSVAIFVLLWINCYLVDSIHLHGTWNLLDRYVLLSKFGFQRTQSDEIEATRGYIYGTVTVSGNNLGLNVTDLGTMVLVDSELISDMYGNATESFWMQNLTSKLTQTEIQWFLETERCRLMFGSMDRIAWHPTCAPWGQLDLVRSVPCPAKSLCTEEDDLRRVIPGVQFTYTVQDLRQPRYWYLSLVACKRNRTTCEWETTAVFHPLAQPNPINYSLTYDIWLVNGQPKLHSYNQFEHQFSFEAQDTAEMYLLALFLYILLAISIQVKLSPFRSIHTILYFVHICLNILGILLTSIHLGVFSFDGRGLGLLSQLGIMIDQWSDALFLALLISTAEMGLIPQTSPQKRFKLHNRITINDYFLLSSSSSSLSPSPSPSPLRSPSPLPTSNLHSKSSGMWTFLAILIGSFVVVQTAFFSWALFDFNPVVHNSIWNTVPCCILLGLRVCVAFWFLYILKNRPFSIIANGFIHSQSAPTSNVHQSISMVHFASGYILWIITLPLVVSITEATVSPLWRTKTLLSILFLCNYVSDVVYAFLLWISNSILNGTEGP